MTHHPIHDRQRQPEGAGHQQIVYQIYPDLTWQAPDTSFDWFEIALHAEVDEYRPPDHRRSREAFSALITVAELLIQRLPLHTSCVVELSSSYYTLHPPACGDFTRTRLSRSLSLVFSSVEPYKHREEPPLLAALRTELALLNISKFETERWDQAGH